MAVEAELCAHSVGENFGGRDFSVVGCRHRSSKGRFAGLRVGGLARDAKTSVWRVGFLFWKVFVSRAGGSALAARRTRPATMKTYQIDVQSSCFCLSIGDMEWNSLSGEDLRLRSTWGDSGSACASWSIWIADRGGLGSGPAFQV